MCFMKLAFLALVLAVSLAMAGIPTLTGDVGGTSNWQGTDVETIFWSQLPTGGAMASQYFPDMYPTYDSGVADDFEFAEATTINKIRWWGGYWNGEAGPHDSPVEIYLYLDDGTGNAPTLPQHFTAISVWMINPGEYTEVADGSNYLLEYVFPTFVTFDPGQKYWFEIRKAFEFTPLGQYGWVQSEPIFLSPCVQGFDGLTPPVIWWTARDTDAAFELIFDDEVTLQRETWGSIKSIF